MSPEGDQMRIASALLCFSIIFSAAWAADPAPLSPTDTYIVARDRYIAAFKDLPDREQQGGRAVEALAGVEQLLRAVVQAWSAPGFWEGKVNLSCTDDDAMGFSALDGLAYEAGDTSVIVTNRTLLMGWLDRRHNKYNDNIPVSIPAAFRAEDFWTFSVSCDAGAQLRGKVRVKAPVRGDLVMVELAVFAQYEATDRDADTLLAVSLHGDRIFIARQKLAVTLDRPAICKKIVDPILAKSAEALKEYQASLKGKPPGKVKDISRFNDHIALKEEAGREYQACFAKNLPEQPNYAAIQKQAQALVDLLH